jgi:hypothetical protein
MDFVWKAEPHKIIDPVIRDDIKRVIKVRCYKNNKIKTGWDKLPQPVCN